MRVVGIFVAFLFALAFWAAALYGQVIFPATTITLRGIVVEYDFWHAELFLLLQGVAFLICLAFAALLKAQPVLFSALFGTLVSVLCIYLFAGPEALFVSSIVVAYLFGISLTLLACIAALLVTALIGLG
jgi:hypothetical protein